MQARAASVDTSVTHSTSYEAIENASSIAINLDSSLYDNNPCKLGLTNLFSDVTHDLALLTQTQLDFSQVVFDTCPSGVATGSAIGDVKYEFQLLSWASGTQT